MTDETTRIARLEEQVEDIEQWINKHQEIGIDVALLKQCIKTHNGSVSEIQKDLKATHDIVVAWRGGIKVLSWFVGGIGLLAVVQLVLGAFGL